MLRAGIWPTARQLVVAIKLPGPRPSRLHLRVERNLDGRAQLAHYLAREPYLEVVLPELLHRFDPVADHLHLHGVHIWLAPTALVDNVLSLTAARPTAHLTIAAALARLPSLPLLRPALRHLPPPDPRQLCLGLPHPS